MRHRAVLTKTVMSKPLSQIYDEVERLHINIYDPVANPAQALPFELQFEPLAGSLSDVPRVNSGGRSGYVSTDDQEADGSQNDSWSSFPGTSIATTPLEYPLHQTLPNPSFGMPQTYLALLPTGYALSDAGQATLMMGGMGALDVASGVIGGAAFVEPLQGSMPPVTDCDWIPLN